MIAKIQNVINWTEEQEPEFLFDKKTIEIHGQPEKFAFSIIIAVYNASNFLSETIDSIINQTFGFEKIQLILVDDGSKDDSLKICKAYAKQYPENIIVVHKSNGGVSTARNVGMRFAKGKYINFLDSDDLFSDNTCTNVFEFFENNETKTDVVTIKVELFGAKQGGTWFNKKFSKGTRIIDLWKEPQVYLNSVSFTFFHNRIKNQLFFDEQLCISEDLKVVNSVLMNKWTLGVLANCTYYYRIHTVQEASLSSAARLKGNWYFTYLDRVYMWLYKKAMAQTSQFPPFLQYTLYRDLFNRFNENRECVKVLKTAEEIALYKEKLFEALSLLDDQTIRGIDVINTDFQLYFYSKKYGAPNIEVDGDSVHFLWKNGELMLSKKLAAMYENCEVKDHKLILEGYLIMNNFGIHFDNEAIKCEVDGVGEVVPYLYDHTNNDKLAFADEYIFKRKYFKVEIPLLNKESATVNFYIEYQGIKIPFAYAGNCKWFGVSAFVQNSYFYQDGGLLFFDKNKLYVKKSNAFEKRKYERKYLKYLKEQGQSKPDFMKGYKVRKLYNLLRFFKVRPIWIISDRRISGGDNGEAFYKFLKKKPFVNQYFVIENYAKDYKRLKSMGFKILEPRTRKFKIKYLLSDVIISAYFEDDQVLPIANKFVPDIVQKKKYVFLQHGITKDDVSAVYSRKNQKLDMFVTAATPEYQSIVNTQTYFSDSSVAKLTGFPRYDYLHNDVKKILLVIPTWRRVLLDHMNHETGNWELKPNFEESHYFKFYSSLMTNERLQQALEKHGYALYYFPHSNMMPTNQYFENLKGFHIVEGEERNYTKMFAQSAIMITDYSSTAFDFGYLRKPILYCQADKKEFFGSHTYTEGYFDYERDGFGKVAYSVDETVDEVIKLLENECKVEDKYLERINGFFPYSDKNNSKRVYEEIKKL